METPPSTLPGQEPPPAAPMSLSGRLLNVFATPGDVFDSVRTAPVSHLNWIVPALLLVAVGILGGLLALSQPAVQQQMREISTVAIEKQIKAMNLPPDKADAARKQAEMFGSIGMKASVIVAPVFVGFVSPFVWGLFVWLVGTKLFKAQFDFMKGVEMIGLANMIAVLEALVRNLLIVATGNFFAAPGFVLLIKDFDAQNPTHTLMALGNVVVLWMIGVRGIALARVSGAGAGKCVVLAFVFWAVYTLAMVAPGLIVQMVMKK